MRRIFPGLMALLMAVGMPARGQDVPGMLSLSTVPGKATVTCDGILREETPLTINGLRPGPHLILVEKPGYLPARRTVNVLAGQRSALEIPLERMTGLILVRSIPDGAEIDVNGAQRGKAPILLTDLPPGTYRIKASMPGFLERDVDVEVENRVPKAVLVSLASDSAVLNVRSIPAGASVVVNGLSRGTTPCKVDRLPAGDNEVVVSLPDYDVFRIRVKLLANEEQTVDVPLKSLPAYLSVISAPTGAKLFADDTLRGETPLTIDNLEAGSHVLRVEKDGYATDSRSVEISRGQRKVEEFKLTIIAGTLEVMTKPNGASVWVDGVEKGVVMPGADDPVGKFSIELPVGEHHVSLRLKGYGAVEKRVKIQRGETVSLREVMKRVFVPDTRVTLTTGDVLTGILGEKLPNGDVKLETQIGIYKTLESFRIDKIVPIKPDETK